jgi:hypothetical protein
MTLRKSILLFASLLTIAALVACSSSSNNNPAAVTAVSGTNNQAVAAATAFAALQVTVTNSDGNPVKGATVTFTAPTAATGVATGTFANSSNTETDTTNTSGVATSSTFTAGTVAGQYTVQATSGSAFTNFTLTNTASTPTTLTLFSGNNQTVATNGYFTSPLVSEVTDAYGNVVQGVSITYTAPTSGAAGTFVSTASNTEAAVTDVNGNATVSDLVANGTAGAFTVTAAATSSTVTLTPTSVPFSETNATASSMFGTGSNYAFFLEGEDTDDTSPYYVAGVFTVGAGGTITAGEQDYRDASNYGTQDAITSGTITTTADGNVQIVLVTADTAVGVSGTETINATLRPSNPNRAVITEFDASGAATGVLRLQDTTAAGTAPSAGYAFVVSGLDGSSNPLSMGGIINVDGTGTMDGTGSIFDANDDMSGTTYQGETIASGTVTTTPDSFGRVVFSITPTDTTDFPAISWAGYIASSSDIYLVETSDSYLGATGGIAHSQGSNTGAFSSSLSGSTYGVVMHGYDAVGALQLVTELGFGAASAGATGDMDFNDLSTQEPASPDPVSASAYTADATGRVTLTIADAATPTPNSYTLQLYLDGNGNALAISMDTSDLLSGSFGGQVTNTGTDANFIGNYAGAFFGLAGSPTTSEEFFSAAGLVSATGTGDAFSGYADINAFGSPTADETLTGTYTYLASSTGVLQPVSITGLDVESSFANPDAFNMYEIDTAGDGVLIETDTNQLTLGILQQ